MRSRFLVSVAMSDLVAVAIAMVLASQIVFDTAVPWEASLRPGESVWPMLGFLGGSMILASIFTERMSGPGVPRPTYGRMVAILVATLFATSALLAVYRDAYWSQAFIFYMSTTWLVPATAHRFIRRRRPWTERIGVITREKTLADDLHVSDHAEVAWVLEPGGASPNALPDRDTSIAVDLGAVLSEEMAQYLSSCDVAGYNIRPFSSIYEEHTGRVPLVHLTEGWEISAPLLEVARWLPGKRVFDVVITIGSAPLWVPVALFVALYLRLVDRGPILFRQQRTGLSGRPFTMYKFRTMHVDAEKAGPQFARSDDPRLLKGAALLRKARLDEIPQLWNVIKGDMSIVGPRAEQVPFVAEFRSAIPFYDHRHMVRPGITGWAQVNYGYADDQADTIEKLTYDLYYIKHMSPVMDLRILSKSIWTVLSGAGAR